MNSSNKRPLENAALPQTKKNGVGLNLDDFLDDFTDEGKVIRPSANVNTNAAVVTTTAPVISNIDTPAAPVTKAVSPPVQFSNLAPATTIVSPVAIRPAASVQQQPVQPTVATTERPLAIRLRNAMTANQAAVNAENSAQQTKDALKAKVKNEAAINLQLCKQIALKLKSLLSMESTVLTNQQRQDILKLCASVLPSETSQTAVLNSEIANAMAGMKELDLEIERLSNDKTTLIQQLQTRLQRSVEKLNQQKEVLAQVNDLPEVTNRLLDSRSQIAAISLPAQLSTVFMTSTLRAANQENLVASKKVNTLKASVAEKSSRNVESSKTLAAESEAFERSIVKAEQELKVYEELSNQANNIIRASRMGSK